MSTVLFLAGAENPAPGLAAAGLNVIFGLVLICISVLLCAMVCALTCLKPIARVEMHSIRGVIGRRAAS